MPVTVDYSAHLERIFSASSRVCFLAHGSSLIRRPMMGELTVTRILSLTMRLVKSMIGSGFIGGILRK